MKKEVLAINNKEFYNVSKEAQELYIELLINSKDKEWTFEVLGEEYTKEQMTKQLWSTYHASKGLGVGTGAELKGYYVDLTDKDAELVNELAQESLLNVEKSYIPKSKSYTLVDKKELEEKGLDAITYPVLFPIHCAFGKENKIHYLYTFILANMDKQTHIFDMKQAQIAEETGMKLRTVESQIKVLKSLGLLEKQGRKFKVIQDAIKPFTYIDSELLPLLLAVEKENAGSVFVYSWMTKNLEKGQEFCKGQILGAMNYKGKEKSNGKTDYNNNYTVITNILEGLKDAGLVSYTEYKFYDKNGKERLLTTGEKKGLVLVDIKLTAGTEIKEGKTHYTYSHAIEAEYSEEEAIKAFIEECKKESLEYIVFLEQEAQLEVMKARLLQLQYKKGICAF